MTNEEKARQIVGYAKNDNIISSGCQDYDKYDNYHTALEMAQWKDEQHKQELIRIYNFVSPYLTPEANNDLKIIIGLC